MNMTIEQNRALFRKWSQEDQGLSWIDFLATAQPGYDGVIMVRWSGMWLGIETDGYTHS